jgi:hypothetical protein
MHLNTEALVDIAEGTRAEASAPHLADCAACRAQLSELRAMLMIAKEGDVPEPSPLFWDHLSARVSQAVANDAQPRRFTLGWVWNWQAGLAIAAALLLVVGLSYRTPGPTVAGVPAVESVAPVELLGAMGTDADASLTVVATLTDDADLDTVREAGLAPRGSAEHAVTHMSDTELRELQRLLKEEMTRSGA